LAPGKYLAIVKKYDFRIAIDIEILVIKKEEASESGKGRHHVVCRKTCKND